MGHEAAAAGRRDHADWVKRREAAKRLKEFLDKPACSIHWQNKKQAPVCGAEEQGCCEKYFYLDDKVKYRYRRNWSRDFKKALKGEEGALTYYCGKYGQRLRQRQKCPTEGGRRKKYYTYKKRSSKRRAKTQYRRKPRRKRTRKVKRRKRRTY